MTDENGSPDSVEFINISKDDAFAWPAVARRTYPSTVNARMDSTVVPFIKKSVEVNDTLLRVFNELLGLPEGTLAEKHKLDEFSGSETRVIKSPPRPEGIDEAKAALAAHTDFGSLVSPESCSHREHDTYVMVYSHSSTIGSEDSRSWFRGQTSGSM